MNRHCRLMHAGYAAVLRTLVDTGATWVSLAQKHDINRMTAQRLLHVFNDLRLIHIAEWEERPVGRRIERTPRYEFGDKPDAPWPGEGSRRKKARAKMPIELLTFTHAVRALQEEALHGTGLADATGMGLQQARKFIAAMHDQRLAFVEDYVMRDIGGYGPALYRFGVDQPDKKKPARKSAKALWTKHNKARKIRRDQARVLRILATGSTKRKPASDDARQAA